MRLIFRDTIGSLRFRRYQHERHGLVETLAKDSVVYVRPCFGLLKRHQEQQEEVAEFRSQKPRAKRMCRHLGDVLKAKRSAGV